MGREEGKIASPHAPQPNPQSSLSPKTHKKRLGTSLGLYDLQKLVVLANREFLVGDGAASTYDPTGKSEKSLTKSHNTITTNNSFRKENRILRTTPAPPHVKLKQRSAEVWNL